jgi:hypothetical protein
MFSHGGFGSDDSKSKLEVANDTRQDVVDIVGKASCQAPFFAIVACAGMGRRQDERFQRMPDHGTEPSSRRQNLGNHARIAADRSVRCGGATKTLQDFLEILKATLPEGMGAIDAVVKIGPRPALRGRITSRIKNVSQIPALSN